MTPEELTAWIKRIGSRAQAARLLGKNTTTLWRWQNGIVPIPPIVDHAIRGLDGKIR